MANGNNIPFTIQSALKETFPTAIYIGSGGNEQRISPDTPTPNSYFIVVIDRTSLDVVFKTIQTQNDVVPSGIERFLNDQYMLVVSTNILSTLNLPQGDFYAFLQENGAGHMLKRLEQISGQLGCGEFGHMSYVLVDTLGISGGGFEASPPIQFSSTTSPIGSGAVLTLELMPVEIDGQTIYTPVRLQD